MIKAHAGETVTITSPSGNESCGTMMFNAGGSWIIIDGLKMNDAGHAGACPHAIWLEPTAQHVRFTNMEVFNAPCNGIIFLSTTNPHSSQSEITNSIFRNNGGTDSQCHGMYIGLDDNLIEGNEAYGNGGYGIQIFGSFDNPDNNIIRNNRVHNNCVSGTGGESTIEGSNNKVYNNTVWGPSSCGAIFNRFDTPVDTLIANNSIYNFSGDGIHCGVGGTGVIVNNLMSSTAGITQGGCTLANNQTTNPGWVNAPTDFHLLSTSTAINTGQTRMEFDVDFEGTRRPQGTAWDKGADEFGPAPSGPVAHWKLDEGTGTSAADSSGNGNTGTLNGPAWTTGRDGSALEFDGVDTVDVAPRSPDPLNLNEAFTLAVWTKPTSGLTGWKALMVKDYTYYLYASAGATQFNPCGDGAILGGFDKADIPQNVCYQPGSPPPGTPGLTPGVWVHLAVTYDGSALKLYLNGLQVASETKSGPVEASTGVFTLGRSQSWGEHYAGVIDDARVYNRALSPAEIQVLAQP